MPVQLSFFAPYHLLIGRTTGELEAPAPFPTKDLPKLLLEAYPGLGNFMADPELANGPDLVADGDELKLLAPLMAG